jgi:hypothetical protein
MKRWTPNERTDDDDDDDESANTQTTSTRFFSLPATSFRNLIPTRLDRQSTHSAI